MTTKDKIIQELEQMPESILEEALEILISLKKKYQAEPHDSDFKKAYLKSKQQRAEVYRRLANS